MTRALHAVPIAVLVIARIVLSVLDASEVGVHAALDAAALVVLVLGQVFGGILGTGFGSVTFAALGLGVPIVALGAVMDALWGAEASSTAGALCLLSAGAGFAVAAPFRRVRFERGLVLGVGGLAIALGARTLMLDGPRSALWMAAPTVVCAASWLAVRWRSARSAAP